MTDTIHAAKGLSFNFAAIRGYVTGVVYGVDGAVEVFAMAAPVDADESAGYRMVHVRLAAKVEAGAYADRYEVAGWAWITRDEFDQAVGMAEIRASLGWKDAPAVAVEVEAPAPRTFPTGSAVSRALKRDAGIITTPVTRAGYHVRDGIKGTTAPSISVSLSDLPDARSDVRDALALAEHLRERGWVVELADGSSVLYVNRIGRRAAAA
ncbi:hypothetical protein SEA_HAMMY_90 [Mycobacterium phage Hammy]|nr:hypothetical protein SEA_HAMMY_90 [Mycobacterium phage Hammy]